MINYRELTGDELMVEMKNVANEVKAFMGHEIISTRKIKDLTNKSNEILAVVDEKLIMSDEMFDIEKMQRLRNKFVVIIEDFERHAKKQQYQKQPGEN